MMGRIAINATRRDIGGGRFNERPVNFRTAAG